jgi:hypothetical protein
MEINTDCFRLLCVALDAILFQHDLNAYDSSHRRSYCPAFSKTVNFTYDCTDPSTHRTAHKLSNGTTFKASNAKAFFPAYTTANCSAKRATYKKSINAAVICADKEAIRPAITSAHESAFWTADPTTNRTAHRTAEHATYAAADAAAYIPAVCAAKHSTVIETYDPTK